MMRFDYRTEPRAPRPGLSAEERALIDAAVAAGRVRTVPPGATGLPHLIWSERERQIVDVSRRKDRRSHNLRQAEATLPNRIAAAEMADAGIPVREIAARIGVHKGTVQGYLRDHRLGHGGV